MYFTFICLCFHWIHCVTPTPDDSEFIWSTKMERKKLLVIVRIWGKHVKEHECLQKTYYISILSKTKATLSLVDLCFANSPMSLTLLITLVILIRVRAGPRTMWPCREGCHRKTPLSVSLPFFFPFGIFLTLFPLVIFAWKLSFQSSSKT